MKIFYAIQATGNGHISRAIQLVPYLQKFGEVDCMLSGANATLDADLPIRYRSKGMSLFYTKCGGLDYKRMWKENSLLRAKREARDLPLHQYDIIINDFDFITSQACKMKNLPSVQFGHQASFMSNNTPRPLKRNAFGELILKRYAPATQYIGLHFQPYDDFIFHPVVKDIFVNTGPKDEGYITVYLPAYEQHCIEHHLKALPDVQFQWFLHGIKNIYTEKNITYLPISNNGFNQSLLNCHGIITGGGFETPAEALHLQKRLMSIPIRAQYEQICNAAALSKMGVMVLNNADTPHFSNDITTWLNTPKPVIDQPANNILQTLEYLFDTYPKNADIPAEQLMIGEV